MIFQHFNLMESRTIFDNVDFSLKYSGKSKQERRQKVNELLELVGLEEKASAYPKQLSGQNNEWQSHELWQMNLKCCYAMKQLVHLIRKRPFRSLHC